MTLFAVTGKAQGLNASEAAIQATDQALSQVGRHQVSLAFIIASHDYPVRDVVNGAAGLLSDTPLFGFSTPAQFTHESMDQRSIIVTLLAGDQVEAEGGWWSESGPGDSFQSGAPLRTFCAKQSDLKALLVAADLHNRDPDSMIETIPGGNYCLAGCLAGGNLSSERSYQIGGSNYGQRGLAAIALKGKIKVTISSKHSWQPIGIYSRITHTTDNVIHSLDGLSAAEKYAQLFGFPAKDWTYPPLKHLVRLYPLGIEGDDPTRTENIPFVVHSPMLMMADGSLLVNSRVTKGSTAFFLVSSTENCLSAARDAAQQALEALGDAEPILALVLADIAWQMMFRAQPGAEIQAVRDVIGEKVPIIGGYTYGQISHSLDRSPRLLNQQFQVILFGNPG